MSDYLGFMKIAKDKGGADGEPVVIILQKRCRRTHVIEQEDEFYLWPRSGMIQWHQTHAIHGFETSPGHQLHNVGKFNLTYV